ncbi:MAG TPA: VOC family protein [Limnochordia bacterium]
MRIRAIDFVVSSVSDLQKAKAFYQDVLGIDAPIILDEARWLEFDTQPVALALGTWERQPATAVGLAVDDVQAAVDELRRKGVQVLMGPSESPMCHFAYIADPDGNLICIHKRKDGTAG